MMRDASPYSSSLFPSVVIRKRGEIDFFFVRNFPPVWEFSFHSNPHVNHPSTFIAYPPPLPISDKGESLRVGVSCYLLILTSGASGPRHTPGPPNL